MEQELFRFATKQPKLAQSSVYEQSPAVEVTNVQWVQTGMHRTKNAADFTQIERRTTNSENAAQPSKRVLKQGSRFGKYFSF